MLIDNLTVFTGPECSGKTTWSKWYADKIGAKWVPEYAREYLEKTGGKYQKEDLLEIAKGQYYLIEEALKINEQVVADTDLLTIKIWSEVKYNSVNQDIIDLWQKQLPQNYILCYPDIPWEYDPLRESPDSREELFKRYKQAITEQHLIILKGNYSDRKTMLKNL